MVALSTISLFPALSIVFGDISEPVFALCYLLLLLASLFWIQAHPRERIIGWTLATLAFISLALPELLRLLTPGVEIKMLLSLSSIGFLSYLEFTLLREILRARSANIGVIYGSISGYLVLGLLGAFWMQFIDEILPGSFYRDQDLLQRYDYVYFSFVSMSTTGYGDILPQNPPAQAVVLVGILLGQIYLTILMAILVGKFLRDVQRD